MNFPLKLMLGLIFSISFSFGLSLEKIKSNLANVAVLDTVDANITLESQASGFSSTSQIHLIQAGKDKMWLEISMPTGMRQRMVQNGSLMKVTDFVSGSSQIVPVAEGASANPIESLQKLFEGGELVSITPQGNSLHAIKMSYPASSSFEEQTFVYSESQNQIVEIHTNAKQAGKSKTTIEYCTSCDKPFPTKMTIESVEQHEYYQVLLNFVSISSPKSFPKGLFVIQ